jgi:hypothetical protein
MNIYMKSIIPSKHHITKLIILDQHEKELHAGPSATITGDELE